MTLNELLEQARRREEQHRQDAAEEIRRRQDFLARKLKDAMPGDLYTLFFRESLISYTENGDGAQISGLADDIVITLSITENRENHTTTFLRIGDNTCNLSRVKNVADHIGSGLLAALDERSRRKQEQHARRSNQLYGRLTRLCELTDDDIEALEAGRYPEMAAAYAAWQQERAEIAAQEQAAARRRAEIAQIKADFKAGPLAAWEAAGAAWEAEWNAKLCIPIPMWRVRYAPNANHEADPTDYLVTIITITKPTDLTWPAAQAQVVDEYTGLIKIRYIGAFLDAEPLSERDAIGHYRKVYWGENFVVSIPPNLTETPPAPDPKPDLAAYIAQVRPDLVVQADKSDIPF